jgi:hypothetical protein
LQASVADSDIRVLIRLEPTAMRQIPAVALFVGLAQPCLAQGLSGPLSKIPHCRPNSPIVEFTPDGKERPLHPKEHDPCIDASPTGLYIISPSKVYSLRCGPYDCDAMASSYFKTGRVPDPIEGR